MSVAWLSLSNSVHTHEIMSDTTPFLRLPPEVRNHIYRWLFAEAVIEDYGFSPTPIRLQNYPLSMTVTCRQIRQESLMILKSATTLHFRLGVVGTPPLPAKVLASICKIRMPARRLQTFDAASFAQLTTLILDVSIEPGLWQLLRQTQMKNRTALHDVSDMIHISMTMGIFERSFDLEKLWRDQTRNFKILCWISSSARESGAAEAVLVDLDRGLILG